MGLEGIPKYYHIFKSDGGEVSRGAREEVNDGLEINQEASSIMGVEQSVWWRENVVYGMEFCLWQNKNTFLEYGTCKLISEKPFCWSVKFKTRLKVKVCVTQSCLTLCNPMDCSPPAPLSTEVSRQAYWGGLPFPIPGDLPNPGIEPRSPTLWSDSLPSKSPGKPSKPE